MIIRWLTLELVIAIHDEELKVTGGCPGLLNKGALESALQRPQQHAYYEPESTISDLTAVLGHGIIKNHCFMDGNKRTALAAMFTFLRFNNHRLTADEPDVVEMVVSLAEDTITLEEFALWIASNTEKLG